MYRENLIAYLKKGASFLKEKKLKEAEVLYKNILAEIPEQPDAYYGLYKLYNLNGDKNKAKKYLEKAINVLIITRHLYEKDKVILGKWLDEYKRIFEEEYIKDLPERNESCERLVEKYLKDKKYSKLFDYISKCKKSKKLLKLLFEALLKTG